MPRTIAEGNYDLVTIAASRQDPLGTAEFPATVSSVTFIPNGAVTGANTNTRRIDIVNEGQAGTGTTVVASLQFDSGVNAVSGDEKAITLSGTPANLVLAEGDVLSVNSVAVGTGIADPGGVIRVEGEYATA